MNRLTYNSRVSVLLKHIKDIVSVNVDNDTYLCIILTVKLRCLAEKYIFSTNPHACIDRTELSTYIRNNLNKFIPEFTKDYAKTLGFNSIAPSVWFENNEERIKFLDKLISIYSGNKTTIKQLFKKHIKFV